MMTRFSESRCIHIRSAFFGTVQVVLEGTVMTRSRKAKLAAKKFAEQFTSHHAKARRLEQQRFDWQRFFAANVPENKVPKYSGEYLCSPQQADTPQVRIVGFHYAHPELGTPERDESTRRDQHMVTLHMNDPEDPELDAAMDRERAIIRDVSFTDFKQIATIERRLQSAVKGQVAIMPNEIKSQHGAAVFGSVDFSGFNVITSTSTNRDLFADEYGAPGVLNPVLVDGEFIEPAESLLWSHTLNFDFLISSRLRSIPGLELCTRTELMDRPHRAWSSARKVLRFRVAYAGDDPEVIGAHVDEVREVLGVPWVGASVQSNDSEELLDDTDAPIPNPKSIWLMVCNQPDNDGRFERNHGMSESVQYSSRADDLERPNVG